MALNTKKQPAKKAAATKKPTTKRSKVVVLDEQEYIKLLKKAAEPKMKDDPCGQNNWVPGDGSLIDLANKATHPHKDFNGEPVNVQQDPYLRSDFAKVGQVAEGNTYDFLPETAIKTSELKTFDFDSQQQYILTENREFSAVCPFSGLPDIATVKIEYYPIGGKCVELKSLKYYLTSFRNVGIYQEGVTKRIYNDLKTLLNTYRIKVTTVYNTRGGFDTTSVEGTLWEGYA